MSYNKISQKVHIIAKNKLFPIILSHNLKKKHIERMLNPTPFLIMICKIIRTKIYVKMVFE